MGILGSFSVDPPLGCGHRVIVTKDCAALVDIVNSANEDDMAGEGEELGRYFGEAMADGYHVIHFLAAADQEVMKLLGGRCTEVGPAVIEHQQAIAEVISDEW